MPQRRRLKKEEEEKLQQQKKALKKSYQKSYSGSKHVGSSRISDTKKYLLIAAVAGVIIIIVAVQFLVPPEPYCYFTEADFIHATLDQGTQSITFDRIVAWYHLRAKHTTINCDILDDYNDTYELELPPVSSHLSATEYGGDQILYQITDVSSVLSFATTMENGTDEPQMSTWVSLSTMETNPTDIERGVEWTRRSESCDGFSSRPCMSCGLTDLGWPLQFRLRLCQKPKRKPGPAMWCRCPSRWRSLPR